MVDIYSPLQIVTAVGEGRTGGPGIISVPGVKAGDILLAVWNNQAFGWFDAGHPQDGKFRPLVVTDDEMYQPNGENFAGQEFTFILLRK